MSRSGPGGAENGRVIRNTLVACRLPEDLKLRMMDYAEERDLTVSQLIRKGVRLLMDIDTGPTPPSSIEWSGR